MIGAGIYEGDILIVDSSVPPGEGKIIIAALDGMLTVKRLGFFNKKPYLIAENPNFEPIPVGQLPRTMLGSTLERSLRLSLNSIPKHIMECRH